MGVFNSFSNRYKDKDAFLMTQSLRRKKYTHTVFRTVHIAFDKWYTHKASGKKQVVNVLSGFCWLNSIRFKRANNCFQTFSFEIICGVTYGGA